MTATIEVFKTNVSSKAAAARVLKVLFDYCPCCKINFDLNDCDNILRIEGDDFEASTVIAIVEETGFGCCVLE